MDDIDDPYTQRRSSFRPQRGSAQSDSAEASSSTTTSRPLTAPASAPTSSSSTAPSSASRQQTSYRLELHEGLSNGSANGQPESQYEEIADETEERDKDRLYALLNIERDATEDQIRDSYRSLAVALHPDKHLDPSSKSAAQSQFREVQRAYEVLSDREKRSVYDYFGEEGLASSWTVSTRGMSPAELRAEFERQKLGKRAKEVEELVKSKGEYTAQIDASALFAPAHRLIRLPNKAGTEVTLQDRWSGVRSGQLVGKHGFSMRITEWIALGFTGQMISRRGMGSGNLIGTLKVQWSPKLALELNTTLMAPHLAILKSEYALNEFTTLQLVLNGQSLAVPPVFNATLVQRLSTESNLVGYTSVRSGIYTVGPWGREAASSGMLRMEPPSVTVGLTSSKNDGNGWSASTSIGEADCNLSFDRGIAPKWLGGATLRAGIGLGLASGVNVFMNGDRSVTENIKLGFGVTGGIPGGVSIRLKFNRLGQRIQVPIVLSPTPRSDLLLLSAAIPLLGLYTLDQFYIAPTKRQKTSRRLEELRRENWQLIKERKLAAKQGVRVLANQARKKAAAERLKGGLVILEAYYGREDVLPSTFLFGEPEDLDRRVWKRSAAEDSTEAEADEAADEASNAFETDAMLAAELFCDVRIPLQALVNKSKLVVPGGRSKSNLLGFYDPAMGERKVLRLKYLFRNQLHEVTFKDKDAVAAPMRAHQV